jgi:hypothetical protein
VITYSATAARRILTPLLGSTWNTSETTTHWYIDLSAFYRYFKARGRHSARKEDDGRKSLDAHPAPP